MSTLAFDKLIHQTDSIPLYDGHIFTS